MILAHLADLHLGFRQFHAQTPAGINQREGGVRRIGSLFSGIGGLEKGLEDAGVGHTVWQVERDPFCRQVLAKHWPDAVRHDDVRTVGAHNLEPVDVICGGFPCQDISYAGKGAGLAGERSGLWYEFARIVGEMGPRYVVVENVAALLTRGLGEVLGTLADLGYDAEWSCVQACDVGAPHGRDRVFIIAHTDSRRSFGGVHHSAHGGSFHAEGAQRVVCRGDGGATAADAGRARGAGLEPAGSAGASRPRWLRREEVVQRIAADPLRAGACWPQPLIRRMDDGFSRRVDRLRALGNAVVPQVAEVVGRRLLAIDAALRQESAA